jgi:hypothetical protein
MASFPNCTSISSYAFANCSNLLSLYLLGSSIISLSTDVFMGTPLSDYTTSTGGVYGSIYVPASLYSDYIAATNWSLYSDRIVSYNGSSESSPSFAARFTKLWTDSNSIYTPSTASNYYALPANSTSPYVTNITYEILTNEAFPLSFSGKTHFMGDGPQLFISSAVPTDIDYLGTKIFEHSDNAMDETSFSSAVIIPAGNIGKYLTAHTWCDDYSTGFYTTIDFGSAYSSYNNEHYIKL